LLQHEIFFFIIVFALGGSPIPHPTKYVHIKSTTVYAPRRNWDFPPTPHPQASVPPPLCFWGEGNTLWRERGWESPNSDEGHTLWYSLYVRTLCHIPFPPDLILYVNLVAMGPVHLSPVTWPQALRYWYSLTPLMHIVAQLRSVDLHNFLGQIPESSQILGASKLPLLE
jgi:hypothetical protein